MDDNTFKLLTLVVTTIGAGFAAWLAFKTNQIGKDAKETKALVNHNMEVQLELYAHSTAVNAELSPTPGAKAIAVAAKKRYDEHVTAQNKIDAKSK